ncbi:hypothetical protein [Tabrizicola aquatica]|uniref:hypothetical protein n=1 Tax=Tabrizicola aquatica TaxID=909926 RepID=UPI000CD0DE00|nr:hypothetical protein [Tabrizicola aquatica]
MSAARLSAGWSRHLALIAVLTLGACVEEAPDGKRLSEADRAACLMQGGTVGRGGLLPDEVCFRPEPDAGKSCTAADDCSGVCLADTRTCSPVSPLFGCFEFLDETGQTVGICID